MVRKATSREKILSMKPVGNHEKNPKKEGVPKVDLPERGAECK